MLWSRSPLTTFRPRGSLWGRSHSLTTSINFNHRYHLQFLYLCSDFIMWQPLSKFRILEKKLNRKSPPTERLWAGWGALAVILLVTGVWKQLQNIDSRSVQKVNFPAAHQTKWRKRVETDALSTASQSSQCYSTSVMLRKYCQILIKGTGHAALSWFIELVWAKSWLLAPCCFFF